MGLFDFDYHDFDTLGRWSETSRDEEGFTGHLKVTSNSISLDTVDNKPWPNSRDTSNAIVTGQDAGGVEFTLFDGFVSSEQHTSSGPIATRYVFSRALRGLKTDKPDEITFNSIYGFSDLLRTWHNESFVKTSYDWDLRQETVVHTLPQNQRYPIPFRRQSVAIAFDRSQKGNGLPQSDIHIKSRVGLGVHFETAVTLEEALEQLNTASCLISLLTGYRCELNHKQLTPVSSGKSSELSGVVNYLFLDNDKHTTESLYPFNLLLTRPAINASLGGLWMNWFYLFELFPSAMHARFGYTRSTFINEQFFSLVGAFEEIHRHLYCTQEMHLRLRLVKACNLFDIIHDVVGNREDIHQFARRVVDLRNAEAHKTSIKIVDGGREYIHIAAKIRTLIDLILLHALGIPVTMTESAMRNCNDYWHFASRKSWPWKF